MVYTRNVFLEEIKESLIGDDVGGDRFCMSTEPSRIEKRPTIRRHHVLRSCRRVQKLFKGLQPSRELAVFLHDLLVSTLEPVYVLGCFSQDRTLQAVLVSFIGRSLIMVDIKPTLLTLGALDG